MFGAGLWFAARKIVSLVVTLIVASFLVFSALTLAPGDPAVALAGNTNNPETLAVIREQFRLDDPLFVRYFAWIGSILQGDFGSSYVFRTDVIELIEPRVSTTVRLVLLSIILILAVGITLGVLAGLGKPAVDTAITVIVSIFMGAPTFIMAILLITLFSVQLGWLPAYGNGSGFWDELRYLILPAIALSATYIAFVGRVTRTSIRGELHSEHVDTARSRGFQKSVYIPHHVLRNASAQIFTVSGITLAGLFAGTAVAEQAFNLKGLGSLLVEAAVRQDLPVVQLLTLFLVAAYVIVNTIVDLLNAAIDPRVAQGKARV